MASIIRYQVTQKQIDEEGTVSDESEYAFDAEYTRLTKQEFTMVSTNTFIPISFGKVETASSVRIVSDEQIDVKFNGGEEFQSIFEGIFNGEFTAISLRNVSGAEAEVSVQIYGS